MMETTESKEKKIDVGAAARLWIGILVPPVAALAQLQAIYLTSEFGCGNSNFTKNHIVAGVAFLISLVALMIAWREWTKTRSEDVVANQEGHGRARFMAMVGVMSGFLFSVLCIALWLPTLTGVPCDK